MTCAVCGRQVNENKWARIRAYDDGWFELKDGTAYCPDHVPAWVQKWRTRQ